MTLISGIDSIVACYLANDKEALFVNYGQRAAYEECKAVSAWCVDNGVKPVYKTVDWFDRFPCGLLYADYDGKWELKNRNGMLINYAATMSDRVVVGFHAGSWAMDTKEDYFLSMSKALACVGVSLSAPCMGLSKQDIVRIAKEHKWEGYAYSCYRGIAPKECDCPACVERKKYF